MLIVFSFLIFLIGLMSEQITQLRFDRSIPFAGEKHRRFTDHGRQSTPLGSQAEMAPAAATPGRIRKLRD